MGGNPREKMKTEKMRVAKDVNANHVNLLIIGDVIKNHCWVKYFSHLVSAQYLRNGHELAYCHVCLHGLKGIAIEGQCTRLDDAKRRRDETEKECLRHGGLKTSFPEDPCVCFTSIEKQVTYFLSLFQPQLSRL